MQDLEALLKGGDLRSIGKSNELVSRIKDQASFDALFKYLFHQDRLIVMRAADAIEKLTLSYPAFLSKHIDQIMELCAVAENKELKWHLALLVPRLHLDDTHLKNIWNIMTQWAQDKKESRIVRVNALQALYDLSKQHTALSKELGLVLKTVEKEHIPAIIARIKKFV